MSNASRSAAPAEADRDTHLRRAARLEWLREPLLHFVVLGALLFALDYALASRSEDPRVIVVDAAVDKEAAQVFTAARGREPTAAELAALRKIWLDNEVLYREGLAMQLDKGDTMIRDRVIFKALSTIEAGVRVPPADEAKLRAYFEKNRKRYDEPARYDFDEAVPAAGQQEAAVRALVAELNSGKPGDVAASLRVFKGRPRANLEQSYGAGFAAELEAAPPGVWRVVRTREAWRALRLAAVVPAKPASFDAFHGVVLQDWKDAMAAEQRTAAVRSLQAKYRIRQEPAR